MEGHIDKTESWGVNRFTYSESQAKRISEYLDCNDDNICKVFQIIWDEGWFDEHDAPMVICLIDKIARAKKRIGRK